MIEALAETIKNIVGFNEKIIWYTSKPDGTHGEFLDISNLSSLGWKAKIKLETGIREVYTQYQMEHVKSEGIE